MGSLDFIQSGSILIAAPTERLDGLAATTLHENLALEFKSRTCSVLIDLSRVDYMTSSALGNLVAMLQRVLAVDKKLAVVAPDEKIRVLLEVAGLNKLLIICSTFKQAEAALLDDVPGMNSTGESA